MPASFRELSAPITVQWEVTPACNKRCVHCYNHWRDSASELAATRQPFDDAAAGAIVADILANRVLHVVITGGEPLLVLDGLLPHAARLTAGGVLVALNSNLMGLTPAMVDGLRSAGIESVLASLPASCPDIDTAITGNPSSWRRTVDGIRVAVAGGMNVGINMVVSRLNLHDIQATADVAAALGVRRMSVTRAMRPGNASEEGFAPLRITPEEFRTLPGELAAIRERTGMRVSSIEGYPLCATDDPDLRDEVRFDRVCRAGKTFVALDMQRRVRPCILLEETHEGDLATAWRSMARFRDISALLPGECAECPTRNTCGGGCKAEALHERGSYSALDPYAEPSRASLSPRGRAASERESSPLPMSGPFRFRSGLKGREEAFGGLLLLDPQHLVPVDVTLYAFFLATGHADFSAGEFAAALGATEEESASTLAYLVRRGIVGVSEPVPATGG